MDPGKTGLSSRSAPSLRAPENTEVCALHTQVTVPKRATWGGCRPRSHSGTWVPSIRHSVTCWVLFVVCMVGTGSLPCLGSIFREEERECGDWASVAYLLAHAPPPHPVPYIRSMTAWGTKASQAFVPSHTHPHPLLRSKRNWSRGTAGHWVTQDRGKTTALCASPISAGPGHSGSGRKLVQSLASLHEGLTGFLGSHSP